jgi:hypothetical protein
MAVSPPLSPLLRPPIRYYPLFQAEEAATRWTLSRAPKLGEVQAPWPLAKPVSMKTPAT